MPDFNLDNPFKLSPVQQSVTSVGYAELARWASEDQANSESDAKKVEIARLRSQHVDYTKNETHWQFLLKSYEGGPDYVGEDTLFSHERENEQSYADRLARASYDNLCHPLVDFVPEYIFAQPVERTADTSVSAEFNKFVVNVDQAGTDFDSFMREVAEDVRLFGHCFIGVDKPQLPPEYKDLRRNLSRAKAAEIGVDQPYLYHVRPLEVLDWTTNAHGKYVYLKRLELTDARVGTDGYAIERYTEWTPYFVQISVVNATDSKDPRLVSQEVITNEWNEVPFVFVANRRSRVNRDLGVSFLQDIAYESRSVFNYTSLIQEFLYRQCFNMLAMEAETSIPTMDRTNREVGNSNVIEYPQNGKAPDYVTPPIDPASFIQSERDKTVSNMYRAAAQDAMGEIFGADARSGDAARQSFGRTVPVIARLADTLQHAELSALTLWAKMLKKEWKGKIAYRDDFGAQSIRDIILDLGSIFKTIQILSPTFVREEWTRIVRLFDGRLDREVVEKIALEIKAVSDEDIIDLINTRAADVKAAEGQASMANMIQGVQQTAYGNDKRRSAATGDKASTKEALPDANKRSGKTATKK